MDILDRLLQHDCWTTRQLLEIAQQLPAELLDKEFDIGHKTVRRTFLHIIANIEIWSQLMLGNKPEPVPGVPSMAELILRLDAAGSQLTNVAESVRDRDGWDETWTDCLDGKSKTYGGAISHVVTHSMHHRAQILYLLRMCGLKNLPEGDVLSWESQL